MTSAPAAPVFADSHPGFSVPRTVFGRHEIRCSTGTTIGVRLPQHSPFAMGNNLHYATTPEWRGGNDADIQDQRWGGAVLPSRGQ
jgi:hypothetical protein